MTYGMPGMFLVASPEACARACLKFASKGRDVAYFPAFWWLIMAFFGSGLALLALKAVTYGPGGMDLSPFCALWYERLNGSWIANLSFDTIVYILRVIHHWNNEFMGTTPTPDPTWQWHPGPILPTPVVPPLPGQPANLNQFLNQN